MMITVIGPNPAIDHIMDVPGFDAGRIWRSRHSLLVAGGKPINVARTLRRLDADVTLVCPLGGRHGEPGVIVDECARLGITLAALPIAGITRTCVIVVDSRTGTASVVNEPGPALSAEEAVAFEALAQQHIAESSLLLGSGSLPPGLPDDFYGRIARRARYLGVRFLLDTSGQALRQALAGKPWALKINTEEAAAIGSGFDIDAAVSEILTGGTEHVVVTQGSEGALYFGPDTRLHVSALPLPAVNPIGAGDAFLAGLATGLARGTSWVEALTLASAAAGLAASQFSPDIGPNPDLATLRAQVRVSR